MSRTDHQIHHRDDDFPGTQSGVVAAPPTEPTSPSRAARDGVEADRTRRSVHFAPPIESPRPARQAVLEAIRTIAPIHGADTEDPTLPSPPATLQMDAMGDIEESTSDALQINAIDDIEESTSVNEPVDGNDNDGVNSSARTSNWMKRRTSPDLVGADLGAVQVNEQAPQLNRIFFRGRARASLIARNRRLRQKRRRGGNADADEGGRELWNEPSRRMITNTNARIITRRSTMTQGEDFSQASGAGPAGPMHASVKPIGQDPLRRSITERVRMAIDAIVRPTREDSLIPIVPEAILVEDRDQDVVIATPTLPWWKERQSWLLIAVVIILAAVSISGWALWTKGSTEDVSSSTPSLSSAPSFWPTAESSAVPSSSAFPSSSPSACVSKIISNSQKIELPLDDPKTPWLAVDGRNMVIAVQDGLDADHLFVVFFTLGDDGNWQRVNTIREDNWVDYGEEYLEVAISGKSAFVGFYLLDIVIVYEQNKFGDWQAVENPFVMDTTHQRFGYHIALDGGLASVTEWEKTYLFYKDGNRWVQFDAIKGGYLCSISGDTIAMAIVEADHFFLQLYKYNSDMKRVLPSQESIPTGWVVSLDLSHNNLVYWDGGYMMDYYLNDTVIYRREDPNREFIFLQQFNIPGAESYYQLALDSDILVLTGDDYVHIFSEESGHWEETIALGHRYQWAALSERTLVAFDGKVDSFNIEECTRKMPTQKPSLSIAPTLWSSSPPSMIPSSSLAPSLSSTPTEICHWVEVATAYDDYPSDASWELKRVAYESDDELVKSHQGSNGDTSHVESICLQEGDYIFIIYSCVGIGIGRYNVTSDGSLIAEGGDFEFEEFTSFLIPFGSHPSMSPSISLPTSSSSPPSKSTAPSLAPSSTLSPTETCFWIEFAVVYDDHPKEVFWRLWRVARGGDEPLKARRGSAGETSHVESICVPEGEYKLTIYGYRGNGICCEHGEGHYNLTWNGALIVKGGKYQTSETTVFSIPFNESTSTTTTTRVDSSLHR